MSCIDNIATMQDNANLLSLQNYKHMSASNSLENHAGSLAPTEYRNCTKGANGANYGAN